MSKRNGTLARKHLRPAFPLTIQRLAYAACALLFSLACWSVYAAGNARYTVDVLRTDKGLPQNSVIAMTQTRDGYLWLGTLKGLARFDGIHFTPFDQSNTPELTSQEIVRLFEDSKTNLWIGTENGGVLVVRDGKVNRIDLGGD